MDGEDGRGKGIQAKARWLRCRYRSYGWQGRSRDRYVRGEDVWWEEDRGGERTGREGDRPGHRRRGARGAQARWARSSRSGIWEGMHLGWLPPGRLANSRCLSWHYLPGAEGCRFGPSDRQLGEALGLPYRPFSHLESARRLRRWPRRLPLAHLLPACVHVLPGHSAAFVPQRERTAPIESARILLSSF